MHQNIKVVVAGGGVLGSQIAFQSAYCGKEVTMWLRSEESIERTRKKLMELTVKYMSTLNEIKVGVRKYYGGFVPVGNNTSDIDFNSISTAISKVGERIKFTTELSEAVNDASIIIESISEDLAIKRDFYKQLSEVAEDDVVIVTNTSNFIPSDFIDVVKNPERFMSLHFANNIWISNIAEIMGHKDTSVTTIASVLDFAQSINMVPSLIKKEKRGYLLNSMLIPFLFSGLELWSNDIAEPKAIDTTWKLSTGSMHGPFEIMDIVGLNTVYAVMSAVNNPAYENVKNRIKTMIDNGETFYRK